MWPRILSFAIGVLALWSLRAQYDTLLEPLASQPLLQKLWFLAGFFTILTNLLVAAHMFAVARGWKFGASRAAGLVVSITMVAAIYHAVLARLWHPQGPAWWADQGLHTAVPVATLVWWLAFAPKSATARDVPSWLIWPATYCVYLLVRGYATGFWPYPFLNGDALAPGTLALNITGLILAFAALGFAVLVLSRLLTSA